MTWLDDLTSAAQSRLDDRVRDELYARGVSDEQICRFRLGHLEGLPPEVDLPEHFVKWSRGGGRLDDVYVLPLTNTRREIRGLQFRHVDRSRSGYEDYILDKWDAVLFGLGEAMEHVWASESIWLVEGGFDLFPIQRAFPGVVATLTARVVKPLVKVMRRTVSEVWVGYDLDDKGRQACAKFKYEHRDDGFAIHEVLYPRVRMPTSDPVRYAKDPSDMWEAVGDVGVRDFVLSTIGTGPC